MRRHFRSVIALACGLASVGGSFSTAAARSRLAPADEYFGRSKMSPLEITNRIHDAEIRGPSYAGLLATQAAIEDWTRKYPADPWIEPREYRMSRLFYRLRSHQGNAEGARCRAFLFAHFKLPGAETPPKIGSVR
jgi:hypothetical protein